MVHELTQQMRFDGDDWWGEVMDECRHGRMTQVTHQFLHGMRTEVGGTFSNVLGSTACGNRCHQDFECAECQEERVRRARVYRSGFNAEGDDRMLSAYYRHAISVVPFNDVKSEICKSGAAQYARDHGENIYFCRATDIVTASSGLLGDKYLRDKKKKWLNKPEKGCGGLMGALPLVRGMRVALTTHIDRSSKRLLKGRIGGGHLVWLTA